MTEQPKTIRIFLPEGNARSIRIAEITSRTVQAIQVPRSKLATASKRNEPKSVGVYFLFGYDEESAKPLVYIGEAEDCYTRLQQHNQQKGFWNTSVIIRSRTKSFTKAHARYLEYLSHRKADNSGRYRLINSVVPSEPYISEPAKADLLDNFSTIRALLSTLGFPIFEEVKRPKAALDLHGSPSQNDSLDIPPTGFPSNREAEDVDPPEEAAEAEESEAFYCEGRGAKAIGEYIEDGFIVFQGSTAAKEETATGKASNPGKVRRRLKKDGTLKLSDNGRTLRFMKDHIFSSPSAASQTVLGRSSNGWTEWKTEDGFTLDALKRQ